METNKITCVNKAGFVQQFRIVWNNGVGDWSKRYPINQSATIDLDKYNIMFGEEVWIEVQAILGKLKASDEKVIYNPLAEDAAVYKTTGTTLHFKIKLQNC